MKIPGVMSQNGGSCRIGKRCYGSSCQGFAWKRRTPTVRLVGAWSPDHAPRPTAGLRDFGIAWSRGWPGQETRPQRAVIQKMCPKTANPDLTVGVRHKVQQTALVTSQASRSL